MDKSETLTKRIEWIDLAKGIGILLVILGHTDIPYLEEYIFGQFELPIFFFLSGYCFSVAENDKFQPFVKKKARTILLPYATFSVIWIVYDIVDYTLHNQISLKWALNDVLQYVVQIRNKPLWFLTCLFCLEILAFLIFKLTKNNKIILTSVVLICVILSFFYCKYFNKPLIWNIDLIIIAMPFFICGNLIKNSINLSKIRLLFVSAVVLLLVSVITNYFNLKISGSMGIDFFRIDFGNILLFYISSMFGLFSVILFSILIKKFSLFCYIGKNSLIFFSLHQIVLFICHDIFNPQGMSGIKFVLVWFGYYIISIIAMFCVTELFNKTDLKVLLGKKKT